MVMLLSSEMTDSEPNEHPCEKQIRSEGKWPSYHSCSLRGKVEHDGKWYCGIHDPIRIKERKEKRYKKWKDKNEYQIEEERRRGAEIHYCAHLATEYLETHQAVICQLS